MIRIGFWGTPCLAARVLEDLLVQGGFDVVFVVTNPDKPFGRSGELRSSPVKECALLKNIPVFQPVKVRGNRDFLDLIGSYNCDYFVVVAYGKILPREVLEVPHKMCINVHGSILPKYRGASPIQSALLHGEEQTGVTIMQMSEGMDEGDMILIRTIAISQNETSESLFQKFGEVSGKTLIEAIIGLENKTLTLTPQNHSEATYCKKIEKEDGLVDWHKSAQEIFQMWQAYTPWPGIYTIYEGKRFLLENVSRGKLKAESGKFGNPGTVVRCEDGCIGIICGEGILTLETVKLEGKKSQSINDFVNGNQGFIGNVLT